MQAPRAQAKRKRTKPKPGHNSKNPANSNGAPKSVLDDDVTPREVLGVSHWAPGREEAISVQYKKMREVFKTAHALCEDPEADSFALRQCLLTSAEMGEQLMVDVQDLGSELAFTIQNYLQAVAHGRALSIQISQMDEQMNQLERKLMQRPAAVPHEVVWPLSVLDGWDRDEESSVDKFMRNAAQLMGASANALIPGIDKHIAKKGAKCYTVAGEDIALVVRNQKVWVRVGGGYVEFYEWCARHHQKLTNFVAFASAPQLKKPGNNTRQPMSKGCLNAQSMPHLDDHAGSPVLKPVPSPSLVESEPPERERAASDHLQVLIRQHGDDVRRLSMVMDREKLRQQAKVEHMVRRRRSQSDVQFNSENMEVLKRERDEARVLVVNLRELVKKQGEELARMRRTYHVPQPDPNDFEEVLREEVAASFISSLHEEVLELRARNKQLVDHGANLERTIRGLGAELQRANAA